MPLVLVLFPQSSHTQFTHLTPNLMGFLAKVAVISALLSNCTPGGDPPFLGKAGGRLEGALAAPAGWRPGRSSPPSICIYVSSLECFPHKSLFAQRLLLKASQTPDSGLPSHPISSHEMPRCISGLHPSLLAHLPHFPGCPQEQGLSLSLLCPLAPRRMLKECWLINSLGEWSPVYQCKRKAA